MPFKILDKILVYHLEALFDRLVPTEKTCDATVGRSKLAFIWSLDYWERSHAVEQMDQSKAFDR